MKINTELCAAIRSVLFEVGARSMTAAALHTYVRDKVREPVIAADVLDHLRHLEGRGEVAHDEHPDDRANLALASWLLTKQGRINFVRS